MMESFFVICLGCVYVLLCRARPRWMKQHRTKGWLCCRGRPSYVLSGGSLLWVVAGLLLLLRHSSDVDLDQELTIQSPGLPRVPHQMPLSWGKKVPKNINLTETPDLFRGWDLSPPTQPKAVTVAGRVITILLRGQPRTGLPLSHIKCPNHISGLDVKKSQGRECAVTCRSYSSFIVSTLD